MEFLYKKLKEKEKEKISRDAKKIISSFEKVLDSLGDFSEDEFVRRDKSFRKERSLFKKGEDFRKKMFKNAKNKNKGFIIAEKKKW